MAKGAPVPQVPDAAPGAAIRFGYDRCSTVGQELRSQLDALAEAQCTRVFSEKIRTRVKVPPELEKAVTLAREIRQAAPGHPVILTGVEMKRLARNVAELMSLSATLQADGIRRGPGDLPGHLVPAYR
ncbi:recombinase family protein [Streptomyces sp. NPDC052040]|uniref:recombinase family protein n=1 Tax=unclassified Streptomyces TaxID=2593676 RepID=UPI0037CF2F7F